MDKLDVLIEAAYAGGRIIREAFRTSEIEIYEKGSADNLVTNIDYSVQETVCGFINKHFPKAVVVSEEDTREISGEQIIYLDPLDGTLNFVHGNDQVAISMGLWIDDEAVAGVVYNPILEDMYYASCIKGGAFLNKKRIRASNTKKISHCLLATGWPYNKYNSENVLHKIFNFWHKSQEIRINGSAALNICLVAAGVFDGYWEADLAAWDYAGGAVIAMEAGCKISSISGEPFSITDGSIIVSNPYIHNQMLETVSRQK